MSSLTKKDVLHVAKLSKLKLSKTETKKFTTQLSEVVDYISGLNEVDTKGIEPTSQTTGLTNVLREDKINETRILSQKQALLNSDKTHNSYFQVSAILKKDQDA